MRYAARIARPPSSMSGRSPKKNAVEVIARHATKISTPWGLFPIYCAESRMRCSHCGRYRMALWLLAPMLFAGANRRTLDKVRRRAEDHIAPRPQRVNPQRYAARLDADADEPCFQLGLSRRGVEAFGLSVDRPTM